MFVPLYGQNHKTEKLSIPLYFYNTISKQKKIVRFKYEQTPKLFDNTRSFDANSCSWHSIVENIDTSQCSFSRRSMIDSNFTNKFPFKANVKLKVYIKGKEHNASGTMIAPNIVLTSAHVIYSEKYKWTDSVIVISNYHDKMKNIQSKSIKFYIFKDYFDNQNMKYDLGLLILNDNIGEITGFLGIGFNNNSSFYTQTGFFYHLSYPSKSFIPSEKGLYNGQKQYFNYGRFDKFIRTYDWVRYKQSAPKGESGSSAFVVKDSLFIIYGVLSMGNSSFVLFTKDKYYAICEIIKQNKF